MSFSSLDVISKMTTENFSIKNSGSQKLLGVTADRNLSFNKHVSNLRKKAIMKIAALIWTFPNMTLKQRRNLMRAISCHSSAAAHWFG